MNNKLFVGVATALVTPFIDGKVDFNSMEKLIERQLESGVDALVFCGTTGEAPTLTEEEKKNIFEFAARTVHGRVPVICGASTNSHETTMRVSRMAKEAGADALLCVSPYYNKGTPSGIVQCYRDICSLGLPVILYNVPSRSGVDIKATVLSELSNESALFGIKECAGVGRISEHKALYGERFALYSGNDAEFLPSLSVGADGVISVLSNLCPSRVKRIYRAFTEGRNSDALSEHIALSEMCSLLFAQTNPAPIKYALSTLGLCENSLRLPMSRIEGELCKKIENEMKKIE